MILLKNCRLIPELTEGYDKQKADVVIDEEKILRITEPGEIKNFNGRIIDVAGNTFARDIPPSEMPDAVTM